MKETFDFKRFWNFFLYDLRNAKNNYGVTFILTALFPALFYVVAVIFNLVFNNTWVPFGYACQIEAFSCALILTIVFFPVKNYGFLTEKRAGSDWITIPASVTEKLVAMLLTSCVVLPLVLAIGFFSVDALVSLMAKGTSVVHHLGAWLRMIDSEFVPFGVWTMYCFWSVNIMIFTLGAVCIKKSKVAKTILSYFAFMMLMSLIAALCLGCLDIDLEAIERLADLDQESFRRTIYAIFYVAAIAPAVLLIAALRWRLGTIKH